MEMAALTVKKSNTSLRLENKYQFEMLIHVHRLQCMYASVSIGCVIQLISSSLSANS